MLYDLPALSADGVPDDALVLITTDENQAGVIVLGHFDDFCRNGAPPENLFNMNAFFCRELGNVVQVALAVLLEALFIVGALLLDEDPRKQKLLQGRRVDDVDRIHPAVVILGEHNRVLRCVDGSLRTRDGHDDGLEELSHTLSPSSRALRIFCTKKTSRSRSSSTPSINFFVSSTSGMTILSSAFTRLCVLRTSLARRQTIVRISAIRARSFNSSKNSMVVASHAPLVLMNEYFSSSRGMSTSLAGRGIPMSFPCFSLVGYSNWIPALASRAFSRPIRTSICFSE